MPVLNKNLPLELIKTLSAKRSREFYLTGPLLAEPILTADASLSRDNNHSTCGPNSSPQRQSPGNQARPVQTNQSTSVDNSTRRAISLPSRRLLLNLTAKEPPVELVSRLCGECSITSGSIRDHCQKELVIRKLIRIDKIQTGKGFSSVWSATDEGFAEVTMPVPSHKWIGGRLHSWISRNVNAHLEISHWHTAREFQTENGLFIDIVARRESELWCFEIGLPPLNKEVHNCLKIWQSNLNPTRVIHVVKDSKDRKQLQSLLAEKPALEPYRNKTEIKLAGEYLRQDKPLTLFQ